MEPKAIRKERVVTYFTDIYWHFTRTSQLLAFVPYTGRGALNNEWGKDMERFDCGPPYVTTLYLSKIRRISFSNTNKNPKVIGIYVVVKLKARDNLIT